LKQGDLLLSLTPLDKAGSVIFVKNKGYNLVFNQSYLIIVRSKLENTISNFLTLFFINVVDQNVLKAVFPIRATHDDNLVLV